MEELMVMKCSDILPVDPARAAAKRHFHPESWQCDVLPKSHTNSDNWELGLFDIFLKRAF